MKAPRSAQSARRTKGAEHYKQLKSEVATKPAKLVENQPERPRNTQQGMARLVMPGILGLPAEEEARIWREYREYKAAGLLHVWFQLYGHLLPKRSTRPRGPRF